MQSFVQEDLWHLRSLGSVDVFEFGTASGSAAMKASHVARQTARQVAWLRRHLPEADLVYGWFADHHLVAPVAMARRRGVPSVVAVAGFDAITLPELGYGVYESAWRAPLARTVLRHTNHVLPCSETMIEHVNTYSAYPDVLRNGIRAHVPGFDTPYTVVPFGFDPEVWPAGPDERAPAVLTVGHVGDERVQRRKGLDLLIAAARLVPEAVVRIVGVPADQAEAVRARYRASSNVELLPPRPRDTLPEAYQTASVYAQLSRAEGQPNVLGEAMCSGCIPVGSPVFGIPETIGSTGYVVDRPDPEHIAGVLRRALAEATPARRAAARARISTHYTSAQRRERLKAVTDTLVR